METVEDIAAPEEPITFYRKSRALERHGREMGETGGSGVEVVHVDRTIAPECAVCGVHEGLKRCSRCRSVYYYSKEHQNSAWKNHKIDCIRTS